MGFIEFNMCNEKIFISFFVGVIVAYFSHFFGSILFKKINKFYLNFKKPSFVPSKIVSYSPANFKLQIKKEV